MNRATLSSVVFVLAASLTGCGSVASDMADQGSWMDEQYARSMYGDDVAITIDAFYRELAPYGQWIEHPRYGLVFLPADPSYRPYRNGRWVETDRGLVWLSYDAIGWAVCHYGAWTILEDGRWGWVPGTEWAPAWVEWRTSEQYVGWAPKLEDGVAPPIEVWVFVEIRVLLIDSLPSMYVPAPQVPSVYASCSSFAPSGGGSVWWGPPLAWLGSHDVSGWTSAPPPAVAAGPPHGGTTGYWPRSRAMQGTVVASPPQQRDPRGRRAASATPGSGRMPVRARRGTVRIGARATPADPGRMPASATPGRRASASATPGTYSRIASATPAEPRRMPASATPGTVREPASATPGTIRIAASATPAGSHGAPASATPGTVREPASATPAHVQREPASATPGTRDTGGSLGYVHANPAPAAPSRAQAHRAPQRVPPPSPVVDPALTPMIVAGPRYVAPPHRVVREPLSPPPRPVRVEPEIRAHPRRIVTQSTPGAWGPPSPYPSGSSSSWSSPAPSDASPAPSHSHEHSSGPAVHASPARRSSSSVHAARASGTGGGGSHVVHVR